MAFIQQILDFLGSAQGALLLGVLFAISELLASMPSIAANSVFQLIVKAIVWLKAKFVKPAV